MALQTYGTKIGPGIQVQLLATDSAFIAAGGLVSSSDTTAIRGFGSNHTVHVQGTVVALASGIFLGNLGITSGEHVLIESSGFVGSYGGAAAVYINASNSLVENRGKVYSTGAFGADGVAFNGIGAGTNRLINSGSIEADWPTATGVINYGTGTVAVTNSGTIRGGTFSYLDFNVSIDQITNTGSMIGTVDLRGGADFYNGASGHLFGHLLAGAGIDTAIGGIENDWFEGGTESDTLTGNAGNDRLLGQDGNDTLNGGLGNDVLDGGSDIDKMFGGAGNDTSFVDNPGDIVSETGGSGVDLVQSSINFRLANAARVIGAVENLTLSNVATALAATGNALANVIAGNNFSNTLSGGNGNDTLSGGLDDDTLHGGFGNDRLLGQSGNDAMFGALGRDISTGGFGNDIFRFTATSQSTVGANADVITDFDDFGNDRIDLSAVFGGVLAYRHNLAFSAAGQVRINDIAGADVIVEVNTGGTLAADMQIRLTSTTLASMNAADFFL